MRIFMIALFMSLWPLSWVNGAETYNHDEERSLSFLTRCVNTFDQARNQWTHSPLGQISVYTQSLWDTAHKNPFMEMGVGVLAVAGAELFLDKSFLSTMGRITEMGQMRTRKVILLNLPFYATLKLITSSNE
jgi:hypothetical protein